MMMICSAPSRLAAITPQMPTAPSPTTATLLPGSTSRDDGCVVSGAQDVGEPEQRRHERVVLADRQAEQRSVGVGDAQRFGLCAVHPVVAEEADVHAGGVQPLVTERAGAVGERERHDDNVAALDGGGRREPTSSTTPIAS